MCTRIFWAQVLVYNMVQDIRNSADEEAAAAGRENRNKYPMHTNENVAIGLFQRDYAKNPFGTGGKESGSKNLENYRKKWSAMYFP
mgnify:CR=1 FL=1